MADKVSPSERYLRTPEAARLLGLSGRTLEKHRTHGTGPRYRKLGGRPMSDLFLTMTERMGVKGVSRIGDSAAAVKTV